MKKITILFLICCSILTTTQAQFVHNEWVEDSVIYTQDNEHYLVKKTILQDVIVSKSTQMDKTTEVHQKIVKRERLQLLPENLRSYTNLDINNAIKQDYLIGIDSTSSLFENAQNKFSNWWLPTVYKMKYRYNVNGFALVSAISYEASFFVMMVTFIFTFLPFQILRFVFAYKYSMFTRKKLNLFWIITYIVITSGGAYAIFGNEKVHFSFWYFVTVINAFVLFFCGLWLYYKVRLMKKEYR